MYATALRLKNTFLDGFDPASSGDLGRNMMKKGKSSKEMGTHDTLNTNSELKLDCYPNPFNPTTTISYQVPAAGLVSLKVYDMLGREVAGLVSGYKGAGKYSVQFNGQDLASGVYFVRSLREAILRLRSSYWSSRLHR